MPMISAPYPAPASASGFAQTVHPLLRRAYRVRLLAILLLASTLNFTDRAILSAVVEPMRLELGLSDIQIGLIQGLAFAVTYSLMGIPVGRLAERRNRLWIVAGCVLFFSVATGLCGFAGGFLQLFLLRIAVGVGEGGFMAPASSLVADHYRPNRRASALAVLLLGMPFGFLTGSLLGGYIAQGWGWRTAFFAMSVPGIAVALLLVFALREPPRGLSEGLIDRGPAVPPPLGAVIRHLFGLGAFRHLLTAAVLCVCGSNAIGQFQLTFLLRVHHLTLAQAGALSGIISFVSLGSGMLIGGNGTDWLERHDRRWYLWVPAIGATIGGLCLLAGFAQTSLTSAVPLIIAGSIFVFLYFAPGYALVQNIAGVRMRASAVAIFGVFSGLLGAGLGPTLAGFASDRIARADFTAGDFSALCRGGRGIDPGSAVDLACRHAAAAGMQGALVAASFFFLWAAIHFLLASRSIRAALDAGARASA